MTITQALTTLRDAFSPVAAEFALSESERVLTFLLDCPRSRLYLNGNRDLAPAMVRALDDIIRRRQLDEPLAYILGSAYFFNREFTVTPAVLIPRPDTEILVEEVLKNESGGRLRFLDLGTGSGCIAAILTEERPAWQCVAIDRSMAALAVARANQRNPLPQVCCDRFSAIKPEKSFDFIVSNPPYIPTPVIATLQESVRCFEPVVALDGGADGLDFFRYLAENAQLLLKPDGRIYCEIGYDQGDSAPAVFRASAWRDITVHKDLGGRPRVVRATRP